MFVYVALYAGGTVLYCQICLRVLFTRMSHRQSFPCVFFFQKQTKSCMEYSNSASLLLNLYTKDFKCPTYKVQYKKNIDENDFFHLFIFNVVL